MKESKLYDRLNDKNKPLSGEMFRLEIRDMLMPAKLSKEEQYAHATNLLQHRQAELFYLIITQAPEVLDILSEMYNDLDSVGGYKERNRNITTHTNTEPEEQRIVDGTRTRMFYTTQTDKAASIYPTGDGLKELIKNLVSEAKFKELSLLINKIPQNALDQNVLMEKPVSWTTTYSDNDTPHHSINTENRGERIFKLLANKLSLRDIQKLELEDHHKARLINQMISPQAYKDRSSISTFSAARFAKRVESFLSELPEGSGFEITGHTHKIMTFNEFGSDKYVPRKNDNLVSYTMDSGSVGRMRIANAVMRVMNDDQRISLLTTPREEGKLNLIQSLAKHGKMREMRMMLNHIPEDRRLELFNSGKSKPFKLAMQRTTRRTALAMLTAVPKDQRETLINESGLDTTNPRVARRLRNIERTIERQENWAETKEKMFNTFKQAFKLDRSGGFCERIQAELFKKIDLANVEVFENPMHGRGL